MPSRYSIRLSIAALAVASATAVAPAHAGPKEITVYKSPECGCCGGWVDHMRNAGYSVRVKDMDDVTTIKEFLRIDDNLWSCHTAVVDGYVFEGHVTRQALERVLSERPKHIRGIALPGMPQGSPGMSGVKDQDWVTYTISDGPPQPYMVE